MVLPERSVAPGDQIGPHLQGACSQRNARSLAADSGDLGSESVQLDLQCQDLTVQPHRVGQAAVTRESAQPIYETNEQVVERELERSEKKLGHGLPVSLTSRPAATGGQFVGDCELFGSTALALVNRQRGSTWPPLCVQRPAHCA